MFPMIRYFFRLRNPFGNYCFPYNLYLWVPPFWYMLKDIWRWFWRGYPACFTWNLDLTISEFVIPLLKQLRDTTHGFPLDMYEDSTKDTYTNEETVTAAEKWSATINKMIKAFENVKNDAAFSAWCDHYKTDMELADKLRAEIDKETTEGLALFAKYFENLWD